MSEKLFAALSSSPRSTVLYSWVCFFLFLISFLILSNDVLSIEGRLWVELFGLFLPFAFGLVFSLKGRSLEPIAKKELSFPSLWLFLFGSLLIFSRFYRLSTLPSWPLSDESVFTALAMNMDQHWDWSPVSSGWQIEPGLLWSLALFFKLMPPSILALRLFTTLWSLAGAGAAYAAARVIWDRSTAWVFALLFSFSFWALGLSRQCASYDLIPFFELTAFFLVGLYTKFPEKRWRYATLLGLWAGLGIYTYVNWVVIWVGLCLFLLTLDIRKEYPKFFLFLFLSLGFAAPWMMARFTAQGLGYFKASFLAPFLWPACFMDYVRGLFWDGSKSFPLGPAQGGYFDIVSAALIGVGSLVAARAFSRKNIFILVAVLLLGFAPGVLTNNLELQRLTPVLPIFILLALLGLRSLLEALRGATALAGWSLALFSILALSWAQLAGPYDVFRPTFTPHHWRSVDYFNAYGILKEKVQKDGPGYLFNEWDADYYDRTLDLATRPFNAAANPKRTSPQWVAFLTNADYDTDLRERFPHLEVYPLDPIAGPEHLLRLFIAPVSDFPAQTLKTWLAADADSRQANLAILQYDRMAAFSALSDKFIPLARRYAQDPFLASSLWERAASFLLVDQNYPGTAACLKQALQASPAVPHLRNNFQLALSLEKR